VPAKTFRNLIELDLYVTLVADDLCLEPATNAQVLPASCRKYLIVAGNPINVRSGTMPSGESADNQELRPNSKTSDDTTKLW
jgi:hypothetical protein